MNNAEAVTDLEGSGWRKQAQMSHFPGGDGTGQKSPVPTTKEDLTARQGILASAVYVYVTKQNILIVTVLGTYVCSLWVFTLDGGSFILPDLTKYCDSLQFRKWCIGYLRCPLVYDVIKSNWCVQTKVEVEGEALVYRWKPWLVPSDSLPHTAKRKRILNLAFLYHFLPSLLRQGTSWTCNSLVARMTDQWVPRSLFLLPVLGLQAHITMPMSSHKYMYTHTNNQVIWIL